MDVAQAIRERRSIRTYLPVRVEDEKLAAVLEAARLAPSARNRQEWRFVVVRDKETRAEVAEACYGQAFVAEAPVIIVACTTGPEYVMTCGQNAGTVDTSIAASFMMLQAAELGLGTCWLGRYHEAKVKELLGIPAEVRVVMVTPLGYAAEEVGQRPRKEHKEVVAWERW